MVSSSSASIHGVVSASPLRRSCHCSFARSSLADQKREKAAVLDAYLDRAVRPAKNAKSAS